MGFLHNAHMNSYYANIDALISTASEGCYTNYSELKISVEKVRYKKPSIFREFRGLDNYLNSQLFDEDSIKAYAIVAYISKELI